MPKAAPSQRLQRINDAIRRELAVLLQQEARDPRFKQITVVSAEVARDLTIAKVYINVPDIDAAGTQDILKALNNPKAAAYFRTLLSSRIDLRTTPKLKFIHDTSTAYGNHLAKLIRDAIAQDEQTPPEE